MLTHYSLVGQCPRVGTKGTATSLGQVPVGCPAGGELHAPKAAVSGSHHCCNNTPQTLCLNQLVVLDVGIPVWLSLVQNQGIGGTGFLLEDLGDNLLSCLLQLLEAGPDPWLM